MLTRGGRGARRVSPPVYRLLMVTHIVVGVGWLGIVAGKLVLGLRAVAAATPERAVAFYTAMEGINIAFPPVAIATLATGILLSLGTKWGILRHYWVAAKLVLALAVIVTAVRIGDLFVRTAISTLTTEPAVGGAVPSAIPFPVTLLLSLSVAHLLMLVVATVLSVYKPWGKTRWGRRGVGRQPYGRAGQQALRERPVGTPTRWRPAARTRHVGPSAGPG